MPPVDDDVTKVPVGRREFLAGLAGAGVGLGLGGISHWFPLPPSEQGPAWSPGREEFIPSTCLLCPSHCGIRGRLVDGRLVRIDGNPLHPVSRGGLCPKGRAGIQLLYHPGRLTGPIERVGPRGSAEFRRIGWDEAITRVADKLSGLRDAGDAASAVWLTGNVTGLMREIIDLFAKSFGTPHVLREGYADGSAEVMSLCQGMDSPPAFDLASSDMVLSFGAALWESWSSLPQATSARDAASSRRPRWVQIDARHSRTAAGADEWVPVRPGTYGTLALGIAYVILKEGLYDADRTRRHVTGIDDWRDGTGAVVPGFRSLALRYGRSEDVSARTGVPVETIVRIGKAFASARRPVAVWDQAVGWRAGGLADAVTIHALNILVGALDRPGGVLVQPDLPVPPLDGRAAGLKAPAVAPDNALSAARWAARVNESDGSRIKALFLYYSNPVASAPVPEEVTCALARIPFVVSFSPFLDETARHADLVLPDHIFLERWQDAPAPASVPIPVWGLVQPVVPALHETRATGDVILDLAARIGGDVAERLPWPSVEAVVGQRGRALASARGGSIFDQPFRRDELRELEARGWWLPHGKSADEFWGSIRLSGGWFDPYYDYHDRSAVSAFERGEVRVFSTETRERIGATVPGLAEGFLPVSAAQAAREEHEDWLRLIPYRVMTLASGTTPLTPWLLENLGVLTGDAWETWAEVNPETGRRLGLAPGQEVRLESEVGGFRARVRFYEGAAPGAVNVPYGLHMSVEGWGRARGANPLAAVGGGRDPSTDLPDWYSTRVRVIPVRA